MSKGCNIHNPGRNRTITEKW